MAKQAADKPPKPRWPLYVGIFVWAVIAATVALAFVESWWG